MNTEKFKEIIEGLGFEPGDQAVPFKGLPVTCTRIHFVQHKNVHLGEEDRRKIRALIGRLENLFGDHLVHVEVRTSTKHEALALSPEEALSRGDLYGAWVWAEIDLGHVAMAPWFDGDEDATAARIYELGRHLYERAGYDVAESTLANGFVYPSHGFADFVEDLDGARVFCEEDAYARVDTNAVPIEWDRWQWMVEDIKSALDDMVDPLEETCVTNEDGVFYIHRRAEETEVVALCFDEGEWYEEEVTFLLVDRLADPVACEVEKAIRGYVAAEEVHNEASTWIEEHPAVVRMAKKCGETLEASMLEDRIDWEKVSMGADTASIIRDAAEKLLADRLDDKSRLFGRYRHLRMLRAFAVRDGRRIVRTPILEGSQTLRYALFQDGAEYHFDLAELFEEGPGAFYDKAVRALATRLRPVTKDGRLYEVAKRVFVGLEDSLDAGNCRPGTMGWVFAHGINPGRIGGVRGDTLLSADPSPLVKRAVEHAARRLGLL